MDQTFRTRELERSGRPVDYRLWFTLPDDSRLTLSLRGLVTRAIETFEGMSPQEMNGAKAGISEAKAEAA